MKKLLMSLGLSFSLISTGFADNSLEQLNTQIAELLSPFQTQSTSAELVFDKIELDAEHTNKLALHGLYRQQSPQNIFELKLDNLSYSNENTQPKTTIKSSLSTDIRQILPQEEINELIPGAAILLEQLVSDYVRQYKDAAVVKGDVTAISQDAEGNYTGLTALFFLKIDLNKLPQNIDLDEVMITDAMVSFSLNIEKGISLDAVLISNPNYRGFMQEERGLKEMLEQLFAADKEAMDAIWALAEDINELATDVLGSRFNLLSYLK